MSKNIILYFSGTGNSLKVAKDVATSLENCEVVQMKKPYQLTESYERIGFVFPTYGMGLPGYVESFLKEVDLGDNKASYFFTITTCGAGPGNALARVKELLASKGASLSFGGYIRMFANYVGLYAMADNAKERAVESDEAIKIIAKSIAQKELKPDFKSSALLALANKFFIGSFPNKDKGFNVSKDCNGCKMCVNVCPVQNIELQDDKPAFDHRCEQCMACIQWCPKQAINYKNKTQNRGRYHHPDISYKEMVRS